MPESGEGLLETAGFSERYIYGMINFAALSILLSIADITFLLCLLFPPASSWDNWVNYGADDSKFCHLCPKGDHTMCKYKGIGQDCRYRGAGPGGVTEEEKREIVEVHNKYRTIVASGREKRGSPGPQPPAADMMKITWDPELARVAQRWADQCKSTHDSCRKDPRGPVGQNIYWKILSKGATVNWTRALEVFYEEVIKFNYHIVEKYRFDSKTGHYTQMVWGQTHLVGCGRRDNDRVQYPTIAPHLSPRNSTGNAPEDFTKKMYVCNYFPAGNWIGDPVYTKGKACTKCPKGTTCLPGESLCSYTLSSGYRTHSQMSHHVQGPIVSHGGGYGTYGHERDYLSTRRRWYTTQKTTTKKKLKKTIGDFFKKFVCKFSHKKK